MQISPILLRFWTWRKNNLWGWVEAGVLTALTLFFCHYMNPANPLYIKTAFPWPWIAPLIIVLHYGFGPSLLSVGMIALMAIFQRDAGTLSVIDFQDYLLSGVTVILICAIFSASWIDRMNNAEVLQAYTDERLQSLSRSYYMLRISSEYLEQNIISKPLTLRMALAALQKLNLEQTTDLSHDVAQSFLQIIAQFCSVNTLGIYLFRDKQLSTVPYAEIGFMGHLAPQDPLIKKCLESREISYSSINEVEDARYCNYLIAVPLITNDDTFLGILAIKEMPFWSLNEEMVRVLSILVYYFIKEIAVNTDLRHLLHIYPDCPVDFLRQLTKLIPLKKAMNIDSAFIAVMVSKDLRPHNVIYNLVNQHRLLDSFWTLEFDDYDVLITLMPFTDAAGIHGYLTRVTNYLQSDLGLSFEKEQIKLRSAQLHGDTPLDAMHYFLNFLKG